MLRALALVCMIVLAGCASHGGDAAVRAESLTSDEARSVNSLLEVLYRSFGHGEGEEPDWDVMRSLFIDGAQFVSEAPAGESPDPQLVDAFISSWKEAIRKNGEPKPEQGEKIISTRMIKIGRLIHVDVAFVAEKSTDPHARKPGLDSLILAKDSGDWKVLSFIVHFESKL